MTQRRPLASSIGYERGETMIVSWMTTNRCNLKCEHCYQDAAECDSRELTTAEGKAMIEQIARRLQDHDLQRR